MDTCAAIFARCVRSIAGSTAFSFVLLPAFFLPPHADEERWGPLPRHPILSGVFTAIPSVVLFKNPDDERHGEA